MIPYEKRHAWIGTVPGEGLPTWAEWLTHSGEALSQRMDTYRSSTIRDAAIGHPRAFASHWAATVGMWGVLSRQEIQARLRPWVSDGSIRSFKHLWKLQTAKRGTINHPTVPCYRVQKAILDDYHKQDDRMDWRLIGNVAGVLPVEAVLYDAAFHGMSILSGKTHKALMRVSKRELKGLWDDLGIRIGPSELVRAGGILPSSSMEMALDA